MLLQPEENLEELLVKLLAGQAGCTAASLQKAVAHNGRLYSIQAVYKELGKLEIQGVVVKAAKKYSLRAPWVLEFADLAQTALQTYADAKLAQVSLPKVGERQIWHFTDLLKLNNFWSQVLLVLLQQSGENSLLTWMPHPWFHLVYSKQEQQYLKALELTRTQLYLINGGQTFLDHWAERFWQAEHIHFSLAASPFAEEDTSIYYNVVGDYLITGRLDKEITREIERLYQQTVSMETLDLPEVFRIFNSRVRATLWVEHKPEKAAAIRKKFERYFGVSLALY